MRFALLLSLFVSFSSQALDEKTVGTTMFTQAMPYFANSPAISLKMIDGVTIRYRYFPSHLEKPLGTILIISGRTEFMAKYAELLYDLRDSGFAFYIYDHRGQGESDRMLDDSRKGFVGDYNHYISDLSELVERVIRPSLKGDLFFLSHSMGGAVSTAYMIRNPDRVQAMVTSSPMYQINTKIPEWMAYAAASIGTSLGFEESYLPKTGAESWQGPKDPSQNELTTSLERYGYMKRLQRENPDWIISGPTFLWAQEAIRLGRFVRENASQLKAPLLVMEGTSDTVVLPEAEEKVELDVPCGRLLKFHRAKHELLIERDAIRNRALQNLISYLRAHRSLF